MNGLKVSKGSKIGLDEIIKEVRKYGLEIDHDQLLDYFIDSFYEDNHLEDLLNYFGVELDEKGNVIKEEEV